jgi:DNA-binding MarR family transcriptional regulator
MKRHRKAISPSPEMDIHRQFEIFMQRSLRGIMGSMKQDGLSMPQIYALMYLYHEGEARISDIGVLMDVGKAAASQLVERLVNAGLVERIDDETDRRAKKIRLQPKSLSMIEKGLRVQRQQMEELMVRLSPQQLQTVEKAFMYLTDAMQKPARQVLVERNTPKGHHPQEEVEIATPMEHRAVGSRDAHRIHKNGREF